ncbi:hypothetical protein PMAYCL1PPCAC_15241, partial [Pristionchus mayeri]
QFSVPFFVMYVPVLIAIIPPIFHTAFSFPDYIEPTLFSLYPSLDALVILFGVHDYRMAALRMFGCFRPKQLVTGHTTMFTANSN